MLRYVIRRILETVPTTAGIVLVAFALFNVVGGSPAEAILGKNATAEAIAAFNHKWGDGNVCDSQLFRFVGDWCRGDFGYSIENQEPVIEVLKRGVGPSLSLTVPILAGCVALGLMLAMLAAHFRGRAVDKAVLVSYNGDYMS